MEPDRATPRRTLNPRSVGITVLLAVAVALLLNPIFWSSLPLLLGRTLFVAVMLLLAFAAAARWRQRSLPRWVAQALAVAITAPLATLLVYLISVNGNVKEFLGSEARLSGFFIIASVGLFLGVLLALTALYRERDAQARAEALRFDLEKNTLERQALDARLATLQAQIEPHFLFNTLANVQALVESGSPRAAAVLQSLIAYLRATLPQLNSVDATLAAEANRVRAYLELMHMRMPDRLSFELTLAPATDALRFPPMALLTLVENAIRHGIDPGCDGGAIEVGARRIDAGSVHAWVADTGVGLADSAGTGAGLANLQARLQAFFGESARLELSEQAPHGVRADMHLNVAG